MPLTFHYFIFFLAYLERGLSLSVFDTYIIEVSLENALSIFQNLALFEHQVGCRLKTFSIRFLQLSLKQPLFITSIKLPGKPQMACLRIDLQCFTF